MNMSDDWRPCLRDFAVDEKAHAIKYFVWQEGEDSISVRLFNQGNCYVAYFVDAEILWAESDVSTPMYYVMVESDQPRRTCIHAMHLHLWVSHLLEIGYPVRIESLADLRDDMIIRRSPYQE